MADPRIDPTPETVNEALQNRAIRHGAYLQHYGNAEARKVKRYIDKEIIPDVLAKIAARQEVTGAIGAGAVTSARLKLQLADLQSVTRKLGVGIPAGLRQDLLDLAQQESVDAQSWLNQSMPVPVETVLPSAIQLATAVLQQPFDGSPLDEWFDNLGKTVQKRVTRSVRRGIVEGQTNEQIARQVRNDLNVTRREALAITRTAVQHSAQAAHAEFYRQNESVVKGIKWVATLDARTCITCATLDGKTFPLDSGPRPPEHVQCRCVAVPVTKSWKELGINAKELPPDTRASMDGQVPADMTYDQWLKKQSAAVQDDMLGVTRGKLFRDGKVKLSAFVNREGQELPLDKLKGK